MRLVAGAALAAALLLTGCGTQSDQAEVESLADGEDVSLETQTYVDYLKQRGL